MRRSVVLLALLALGAAGCGGGSSSSTGGGAKTTTATSATGRADVTVSMKDIMFAPKAITITRGQTVRWTNDDQVPHNVTKQTGPGTLQSPTVDPGKTYQAKLDTPGRIAYVCTIHPTQTGTITVK